MAEFPSYAELRRNPKGAPPGSSWEVFGRGDQRGSLNFLGPEKVVQASALVKRGVGFNLDYPVNSFSPFPSGAREDATHTIFQNNPNHRDDVLDRYYPQSSSQIDGLRHIRNPRFGFYGGTPDEHIAEGTGELGIQHWARPGIITRGILADVERSRRAMGRPLRQADPDAITVEDLRTALDQQGCRLNPGDALLVRTGWATHFLETSVEDRRALIGNLRSPGLEQSHDMVAFLWDNQISLVAADNIALEVMPPSGDSPFRYTGDEAQAVRGVSNSGMMHRALIPLLGFAIGELWSLDELASDCADDGVYEFMTVAKPINLVGGVGSPANAVAIK
jgi:kynurenine formamidase